MVFRLRVWAVLLGVIGIYAVCTPGDRAYCENRGVCSASGAGCECDDNLHYWPSERCVYRHPGRELATGQFCFPGTSDFYCSWLGSCNEDGTACDCVEADHRSSADRCASWSSSGGGGTSAAPTPAPAPLTATCAPGDRVYCHNRGACTEDGDTCICDDSLHYWSSERCSTYHDGGELGPSQCCIPGQVDYYCSWMGVCDSTGSGCMCFDPDHYSPAQRCAVWHSDVAAAQIESSAYSCQTPSLSVISGCLEPAVLSFNAHLDAYQSICARISASDSLTALNATLRFEDSSGGSSPADLEVSVRSVFAAASLVVGGWDHDDRVNELEWPAWWQAVDPGFYSSVVNVSSYGLSGTGYYEVCLSNKYILSGGVAYKGTIQLIGLQTECDVTLSPSATPQIDLSSVCSEDATLSFDLSLGAKQSVCSDLFGGNGKLLAVNVETSFSSLTDSVPEWASDLELKVLQPSSGKSVVVGFDAKDNQFYDDDNEEDPDGGAVFHVLSLDNGGGNWVDLMSADLWLSPSSQLTAPMATDAVSCDGSFCAEFTSEGTFVAKGNAQNNSYYVRYATGPLTAPFHLKASILRDYSCDDHFVVLSSNPLGSTFDFKSRADAVSFTWDCKQKYIYGPSSKEGAYCGAAGFYELDIAVDVAGIATFTDNVCETITLNISGMGNSFYLFVGADNDGAYGTASNNIIGVNHYDLEWPVAWRSDVSGHFAASFLLSNSPFKNGDSYQVCFTNSWKDAVQSSYSGNVKMIGVQTCSNPTPKPTVAPPTPSTTPVPTPVVGSTCSPGDRSYCNYRGSCSTTGDGCECDDVLHYWPSERCKKWHKGGELALGLYCSPGRVDYYCSWLGQCNSAGTACLCFDTSHRSSADRCASWSSSGGGGTSAAPTPAPAPLTTTCAPGDRVYCHNRGACTEDGDTCICDDSLHYWSSERCSTYHDGGELGPSQCCVPDTIDYYCSWMGTCDSTGSGCICHDVDHRSSSDRCQTWQSNLSSTALTAQSNSCPALMSIPSDEENIGSSSQGSAASSWLWGVIAVCVLAAAAVGIFWFRTRAQATESTLVGTEPSHAPAPLDKRIPSGTTFSMDNPSIGSASANKFKSRLSRGSAAGYDELDEYHDHRAPVIYDDDEVQL